MAEYHGELILIGGYLEHALVHADAAAGQGEGVGGVVADDLHLPLIGVPRRRQLSDQRIRHAGGVGALARGIDKLALLAHVVERGDTHLTHLRIGHDHQLRTAGGRGDATRQDGGGEGGGGKSSAHGRNSLWMARHSG